jgi:hypothetical protein
LRSSPLVKSLAIELFHMKTMLSSQCLGFQCKTAGAAALALTLHAHADTVLFSETFEVSPVNWTLTNEAYWSSAGGNPGGCVVLNNAGQVGFDPSVARIVTGLQVGRRYRLRGEFKDYFGYCPQPTEISFRVDLDGVTAYASVSQSQWTQLNHEWIAGSTQVTIRFRAETDGTDCDAAIDNITVTDISPPCLGDVSGNRTVDGVDLAAILSNWGTSGQGQFVTDINADGTVDGADLAFVLGGWGPCP